MGEVVAYCALCMKTGWDVFVVGDLRGVFADPATDDNCRRLVTAETRGDRPAGTIYSVTVGSRASLLG